MDASFHCGRNLGGFLGSIAWSSLLRSANPSQGCKKFFGLYYVIGGLCFGVVTTLGSRAYRPPLVFLGIVFILAWLVIGLYLRRFRRQ
jgi:hypothetical protein